MKEKGIQYIESLQFEDHELLRRAATECMCNMVMNEEVCDDILNTVIPVFASDYVCRCLKCMSKTHQQKE